MAYTLGKQCARNLRKQTVLVQLVIENMVTCFLRHSVHSTSVSTTVKWSAGMTHCLQCGKWHARPTVKWSAGMTHCLQCGKWHARPTVKWSAGMTHCLRCGKWHARPTVKWSAGMTHCLRCGKWHVRCSCIGVCVLGCSMEEKHSEDTADSRDGCTCTAL